MSGHARTKPQLPTLILYYGVGFGGIVQGSLLPGPHIMPALLMTGAFIMLRIKALAPVISYNNALCWGPLAIAL